MVKIKPLGENILVKLSKKENQTRGGLFIPDSASEEKPQEGKVVAVGDSKKIMIKKNQKVLFAKYTGTEINIEKETYLILKNEDILAVIE